MAHDDTKETEYEPRKGELLIAALLAKPTIEQAAKEAGISNRTALRWLSEPDFAAKYRAARRHAVEGAIAVLQQRLMLASATFVEIASDKDKPASARIAAARAMYEFSLRGVELLDHEERLAELEARLQERK